VPAAVSAGLLLHRLREGTLEVLLAHPGGPFWACRDDGAWSIPKGELDAGEEPLHAARREFAEELGAPAPDGAPLPLGEVRLKSRKRVVAWALPGDFDPETMASNTFEVEWPPRSGTLRTYPEVDRAAWFDLPTARRKLLPGQLPLLESLAAQLGAGATGAASP
jgi:predicted NUDIX family NTP pyrophosphohydrolase